MIFLKTLTLLNFLACLVFERTFMIDDSCITSLKIGKYEWIAYDIMIAIGYASLARGTGILFIKIGVRIPPPVHVKIIEINLYDVTFSVIVEKTLLPFFRHD